MNSIELLNRVIILFSKNMPAFYANVAYRMQNLLYSRNIVIAWGQKMKNYICVPFFFVIC